LFGWTCIASAAETDSLSADELTLRTAQVGTDGQSLLQFFRKLVPKDDRFEAIPPLIRLLGHESFTVREEATGRLVSIGPAAVPGLRQAAADADPEIRRRAQHCLQQMAHAPDGPLAAAAATPLVMFHPRPGALETLAAYVSAWGSLERSGNPLVIMTAARVLAARRPPGTAQILLGYLPFVMDGSVNEEIDSALAAVAVRQGNPDPDVLSALKDRLGIRRAAAAGALCRAGGFPLVNRLRPLLRDPDPSVRQRVAGILVELRDPEALPVLIAILDQVPPAEAQLVLESLRQVAGELAPSVNPGGQTADSWRKCREAWEIWWRGVDGRTLLQLFHRRTPLDSDRDRLLTLVGELGDDEFEVRERASTRLRSMGPVALPVLRQALKDPDPEVVFRAQICKDQIEKGGRELVRTGTAAAIGLGCRAPVLLPGFLQSVQQIEKDPAALIPNGAARLLAMRHPAGAAEVLLAYAPFVEDETEAEEIQSALTTLAFLGGPGDAALVRALDDKTSLRRAMAAVALCRARGVNGAPQALRLLHDPDPLVRLRLGLALADLKDKEAIPGLIDLLADLSEDQAWPVEDLLRRLADDRGPANPSASDSNARRKWRDTWAAWWREHSAEVDLASPDRSPRLLGYSVVAEYTDGRNGRVLELGTDHKIRWKVENIPWPLDVQVLPGQRLLLTEFYDNRVAERNFKGELLWHKQLTQAPLTARRLPNGNTLIVTQNQILEVDRNSRDVSTINRPGVQAADKLRNGRIASIDSAGGFVVHDAAGRSIKSFSVGPFESYCSFQVLPDGGVVVPLKGRNQIVEFNAQGKRVWEAHALQPTSAVRLPNGHTLVSCRDAQLIIELDRSGKEAWQYKSTGYPWRAYQR
jgi:HEAT repeat protein